ncbi:hypothetical protein [Serratia sp. (in: enterobacteria)]
MGMTPEQLWPSRYLNKAPSIHAKKG